MLFAADYIISLSNKEEGFRVFPSMVMFVNVRKLLKGTTFLVGLAWLAGAYAEPVFFSEASLEEAVSNALRVDPSKLTKELMATRLKVLELNGA